MPIVKAENLMSGYGDKTVLSGISFSIEPGEIVTLLGHNGAGKTTTLKTIMGLLPLRGGTVAFVTPTKHAYHEDPVHREEGGTPAIVESIRAGLVFQLKEAVGTVVWTANPGVRIGPSEFGEFEVSGGPLPANADKLVMPAVQTYDNGKVVSWIDQPAANGAEPEHPAPVVQLAKADAKDGDGDDQAAAPANAQAGSGGGSPAKARSGGGGSA